MSLLIVLIAFASSSLAAQDTTVARRDPMFEPIGKPKSAIVARTLGIIPGAGHMYAGETGRGFAYLGGMVAILGIGTLGILGDCVDDATGGGSGSDGECSSTDVIADVTTAAFLGLWGWSIYDAGRAAKRWNVRHGHSISSLIVAPTSPLLEGGDRRGARIGVRIALP